MRSTSGWSATLLGAMGSVIVASVGSAIWSARAPGWADRRAPLPATTQIDYVRVWS